MKTQPPDPSFLDLRLRKTQEGKSLASYADILGTRHAIFLPLPIAWRAQRMCAQEARKSHDCWEFIVVEKLRFHIVCPHENTNPAFSNFFRFEEHFRKASFSWRICQSWQETMIWENTSPYPLIIFKNLFLASRHAVKVLVPLSVLWSHSLCYNCLPVCVLLLLAAGKTMAGEECKCGNIWLNLKDKNIFWFFVAMNDANVFLLGASSLEER